MNTTLLNLRVSNQVKDDFQTVCKLNSTTMTGEIVRFMSQFITDEIKRFKDYQNDSKEIEHLKKKRVTNNIKQTPIYETHGDMIKDPFTQTWVNKNSLGGLL